MKNQRKQVFSLIAASLSSLVFTHAGIAETSVGAVQPSASSAVPISTPINESPDSVLTDMAETLRRLYRASIDLTTEVSRHNEVPMQGRQVMLWDNMYSMYQPGVGNNQMMVPTVEGPVLPARKKFVDQSMEQINKLTKLLAADVTALPITSAGGGKEADERRAQTEVAQDTIKDLETKVVSLNEKTQGPAYDNVAIAKSARALSQQYEGLEALRKRLQKMYDKR